MVSIGNIKEAGDRLNLAIDRMNYWAASTGSKHSSEFYNDACMDVNKLRSEFDTLVIEYRGTLTLGGVHNGNCKIHK